MKKKLATMMCVAGCMGILLTGCQKTPEKKSVVQKSTSAMLNKESENKETLSKVSSSLEGEMINSKAKYMKKAKADVGEATKTSVYQVKEDTFTQEQADRFLEVATEGNEFYKLDDAWDKKRYKDEIKMIKEEIAANKCGDEIYQDSSKTYNETLEEYKKAYEKAPDGDSKEKASRQFVKTRDKGESIYGYVKLKDGTKRAIRVANNNYLAAGLNPTQMCFADLKNDFASYVNFDPNDAKNAIKKGLTISKEKAVSEAEKMIEKLGIKDFSWTGYCREVADEMPEAGKKTEMNCAYSLIFTRQLGGVNLAVPNDMRDLVQPLKLDSSAREGNDSEEAMEIDSDYVEKLDYEAINIVVNDKGVVLFNYAAPFKLQKTIVEDAHLLSAKDLIEAVMTVVSNSSSDESGSSSYDVKKVRLGYQKIQEEGSDDTTLLVPVWNFIGDSIYSGEFTDADGKEVKMDSVSSDTYLWTINAIDGSEVNTTNALG